MVRSERVRGGGAVSARPRRVLVIDDDARFRSALRRWLRRLGYDAVLVGTAEDGIRLIGREPFYAALLDLNLPGLQGHALLRQLRGASGGDLPLPVIVITGSIEMDDAVLALREGASDFLRKPFQMSDLANALDRVEATPEPGAGAGPAASAPEGAVRAQPAAEAPRSAAPVDLAAIFEQLQSEVAAGPARIPVLDPRITELHDLLQDPRASMHQVAAAIGRDPSLTASMLRTANSPHYFRGREVTSLRDACVRIGVGRVALIAFECVLKNRFLVSRPPWRGLLLAQWRNAVATSRLVGLLARQLEHPEEGTLQVAGLLHNVGEVACVHHLAETLEPGVTVPEAALVEAVAAVHEEIGLAVATAWRLPRSTAQLIGHHHRPRGRGVAGGAGGPEPGHGRLGAGARRGLPGPAGRRVAGPRGRAAAARARGAAPGGADRGGAWLGPGVGPLSAPPRRSGRPGSARGGAARRGRPSGAAVTPRASTGDTPGPAGARRRRSAPCGRGGSPSPRGTRPP